MARKMSGYEYIRDGHYRVKVVISSDHLKMKAVPNDKPCTAFSQSMLALHTHTHTKTSEQGKANIMHSPFIWKLQREKQRKEEGKNE